MQNDLDVSAASHAVVQWPIYLKAAAVPLDVHHSLDRRFVLYHKPRRELHCLRSCRGIGGLFLVRGIEARILLDVQNKLRIIQNIKYFRVVLIIILKGLRYVKLKKKLMTPQ